MNKQNARPQPIAIPRRAIKLTKGSSKVDETYGHLLDLAHRLGPLAKMPTVRALREEMNISQATLDAALSRLEGQNVLVRRQGSGVYVSNRLRQRNIALLCDVEFFLAHGGSPFWSLLIEQIRELAAKNEAHLSLHFLRPFHQQTISHPQDPEPLSPALRDEIERGGIHGLLAIGAPHPVTRWIEAQGVPVVAYAGAANYMFGQSAATMIQLGIADLVRQGCERIEPWFHIDFDVQQGGTSAYHSLHEVYRGAMLSYGLAPLSPHRVPTFESKSLSGAEEGYLRAMKQFGPGGSHSELPDAILSTDDMQTQGLLMALYRLRIEPGTTIRVATHSNAGSMALAAWHHQITRLEYDLTTLVQLMFETLNALIGGEPPSWEEQAVHVPEKMFMLEPRLIRSGDG